METVENNSVKFDIIRPKKEPRSAPKKRITFDNKVIVRTSKNQDDVKPEETAKDRKKGNDKSKEVKLPPVDDDSENQGFGEWLHSPDGTDMMRLFVIANSLLVLLTMAWPQMQIALSALRELIFGEDE